MANFKLQLEKISWQIILILFAIFFFALNLLMPFFADDILYAFIWDGEHGGNFVDVMIPHQRIESFTDILISQWSHYFHWGGRTIAHIIVQFFSWQGKAYFDVLNVIIFCALVILIFKIATGLTLREMNKKYLLFILAALYFMTPDFAIAAVWMTGAINYLWMVTFALLFILPFAIKYRDKNFWRKSSSSVPLMAILGLIAGWSSETGAALTIFVIFFSLINFWREKNLQTWQMTGFLFLTIGFFLVTTAPGNTEQAKACGFYPDAVHYTLEAFLFRLNYSFLPILSRESILFLPIIFYFISGRKNFDATKFILTFLTASTGILCAMMFVPMFEQRAGFSASIFLTMASLAALKEILPELEKIFMRHVKIFKSFAMLVILGWLIHMGACLYVYADINAQFDERWKIIDANRDSDEITVPPLVLPSWSEKIVGQRTWTKYAIFAGDIGAVSQWHHNSMFAQYYGLKKIRVDENLKRSND